MNVKILVSAMLGGTAVALLTGMISSTPPMLLGEIWYGYPLAWLFQLVIAPEYIPWRADVLSLTIDILFWTVIVGILILVLTRVKKVKFNKFLLGSAYISSME